MYGPSQARWTGSAIIEANIEQVWKTLLDISLATTPLDRRALAQANKPLHLTTTIGEPPIGRMHVEIDRHQHSIGLQGEWWYRGVRSLEVHKQGCLLVYRVYNVAPSATRWLVPLVHRPFDARMQQEFQQMFQSIGERLHCATALVAP